MAIGVRGSGKSTLLENIGIKYLKKGVGILDLYGARDGESLAWLRSPEVKNDDKKVLLLHGSNSSVASCYDSKPAINFKLSDLNNYDIIISSGPLYSSLDQELSEVNTVVDQCFTRHAYKRIFYVIAREAANIAYSRLKVVSGSNIKSVLLVFIREMRHSGFALGIDTQKVTSIDLDIRTSLDYLLLKSLGYLGLPDELRWMYSIYNPYKLQNMPHDHFVAVTKQGGTGVGNFPYHDWHKVPGEDILKETGIEVEHGEIPLPTIKGGRKGDLTHKRIIELYKSGLSYNAIEAAFNGEVTHGTVGNHIKRHNKDVKEIGVCPKCRRSESEYASQLIEKP